MSVSTALQFRIFPKNVSYAGRIEAMVAKMWGVVNEKQWDMTSSDVVCKQHGYAGAEMVLYTAGHVFAFERGGIEWVRDVRCNGTESSLSECDYTIEFDNDPSQDAGVVCKTNHSGMIILLCLYNVFISGHMPLSAVIIFSYYPSHKKKKIKEM